jgi:hypothetical protein
VKHPDNAYEGLARLGYASRGLVYLLLGGLALFSGAAGGGTDSTQGALSTLLSQPFGRIILGIASIGFFGFAAWRVAQGAFNADRREANLKNGLARTGKMISAAAYLSLGVLSAAMALGLDGGGSGQGSEEGLTATVLGLPFGQFLVGAAGLAVFVGGLGNIWKGISGAYRKRLDLPARARKPLLALCTFGIAARGALFAIVGGFLLYAAISVRPDQAGSVGEALDWVRSLPFGGILYLVAALGLVAFAASCVVYALYRHVNAPSAGRVGDAARGAIGKVMKSGGHA